MAVRSYLWVVLSLSLAATAAGMFTALVWMVWKLVSGFPVLPPWPKRPRIVPWGGFTIVLVVVAWVAVNLAVSAAYLEIRSSSRIRLAEKPARGAPKIPSQPPGTSEAAAPRFTFTEQMVLVSLINGALLLVVPLGVRLTSGAKWQDLGLTGDALVRNLKMGAIAFLAITPVVMSVNALAQLVWKPNRHPLERMLREEASPGLIVLAYVSAVVLAPAVEELIFRGIIQGWLRRLLNTIPDSESNLTGESVLITSDQEKPESAKLASLFRGFPRIPTAFIAGTARPGNPYNPPVSDLTGWENPGQWFANPMEGRYLPIFLTSVLFAAVHFEQMPAPLAIFPLALVLGLLFETTGSLVPSFILHALFNGFNTTVLVLALIGGSEVKP